MSLLPSFSPLTPAIRHYWELVHLFAFENLNDRYRGSFLGILWSLMHPLVMTTLYSTVLGKVFIQYYDNSVINYALAVFVGLSVMQFFSASSSQSLQSVVKKESLLNKVALPVSIFPFSVILANIFQLGFSVLPLLIIGTIIITHNVFHILLLFLPWVALIFLSTGVGLLMSSLYIFFRDLPYLYDIFTSVLFIGSPIFYPANVIPERVVPFLSLNPLFPIIKSLRTIVLTNDLPDTFVLGKALISGFIIFGLGWICFQSLRPRFMDML